ncbi:ChrR family anti-sigma-E factor [Corallincola platygyrae]|uniref:ChrR family anti-sigma-E factor n=1 Tax=Corallincola platygyrae TaxID=1193278 RepID=A0ABW4XNH1_9GAMM
MSLIKHHPTTELLQQFANGTTSPALSLAVSAHVDMCPHCQRALDVIEAELAQAWSLKEEPALQTQESALPDEFSQMFDAIVAEPAERMVETKPVSTSIALGDRQFILPRALQRFTDVKGKWLHLGKLARASLPLDDEAKASFIYIEGDGQIPEHTHGGVEWTLVLDGSFSDEEGKYNAGDFIRCDGSHKHSPRTEMGEDCLCFAVVEAPLHFTSGLSRLLNPIARFMQ